MLKNNNRKMEKNLENTILEKEQNLGLSYDEFVSRLNESQKTVLFLKDYIEKKGYEVHAPALKITPDVKSRAEYSDEVDLYFFRKNKERVNVEVKHRSLNFTCKEDYPYDDVFVNSITGFDNKKVKPDLHILLSKNKKHAAIVDLSTKEHWVLRQQYDRVKQQKLWFYFLDVEHVKFVTL